jgi:hypothetical protein
MGLWGSKPQKEISIQNAEVYVTEDAISNILKSSSSPSTNQSGKPEEKATTTESSDSAAADLADRRLVEYEKNLIKGFNNASKEVEELFRERYKSLPVCFDLQKSVSQCYSENARLPLKCVDIANQFVRCVEKERQAKFGLPPTNINLSKA